MINRNIIYKSSRKTNIYKIKKSQCPYKPEDNKILKWNALKHYTQTNILDKCRTEMCLRVEQRQLIPSRPSLQESLEQLCTKNYFHENTFRLKYH